MRRGTNFLFAGFLAGLVLILSGQGAREVSAAAISGLTPRAIFGSPPDAAAAIQNATRQFNAGNYSGAIATLQPSVSQNPNNAEIYYWLGRSYYELHDYDNAVTNGEKSIEIDPKNSNYHLWLGRAYGGKADREHSFSLAKKVKKEFEDAVSANPSNISARRDLEEFNIDAPWIVGGSKDEAKAQVEAIAAIDPVEGHLARAIYDCRRLRSPMRRIASTSRCLLRSPKRSSPILKRRILPEAE